MSVEQYEIVLPTNGDDLQRIQDAMKEYSGNLTQIESFRQLNTDIVNAMKDAFGIKPDDFKRLARIYHKQEKDKVFGKSQQLEEAYDTIFSVGKLNQGS